MIFFNLRSSFSDLFRPFAFIKSKLSGNYLEENQMLRMIRCEGGRVEIENVRIVVQLGIRRESKITVRELKFEENSIHVRYSASRGRAAHKNEVNVEILCSSCATRNFARSVRWPFIGRAIYQARSGQRTPFV